MLFMNGCVVCRYGELENQTLLKEMASWTTGAKVGMYRISGRPDNQTFLISCVRLDTGFDLSGRIPVLKIAGYPAKL
jgi:hypothetical protein